MIVEWPRIWSTNQRFSVSSLFVPFNQIELGFIRRSQKCLERRSQGLSPYQNQLVAPRLSHLLPHLFHSSLFLSTALGARCARDDAAASHVPISQKSTVARRREECLPRWDVVAIRPCRLQVLNH